MIHSITKLKLERSRARGGQSKQSRFRQRGSVLATAELGSRSVQSPLNRKAIGLVPSAYCPCRTEYMHTTHDWLTA